MYRAVGDDFGRVALTEEPSADGLVADVGEVSDVNNGPPLAGERRLEAAGDGIDEAEGLTRGWAEGENDEAEDGVTADDDDDAVRSRARPRFRQ